MNRDLVVGIVGAAILVAAMVGVFYYEKNNVTPDVTGSGELTNATGPDAKGTTALGATSDQTLRINQTKLVNVTFTLKWTAAQGRDSLKLTVAPSNATGVTTGGTAGPSESGTLTVTIPIEQNATGTVGVGDWKVSVQFASANAGTPVTPPVTPPVGTDASVSWTVTTSLQTKA